MARYAGLVGYVTDVESVPGVWVPVETPVPMRGDVINQDYSVQDDGKVNSNITLNHRVSLLGDAYAFGHYQNIKWVSIDGRKWEVSSVKIQRPRIILTVGGLWNGV